MVNRKDNLVPQMKGELFDNFFSRGYYRMQQSIFTTDEYFSPDSDQMFDVFWLRTLIDKVKDIKSHKVYKANKNFTVQFSSSVYNDEIDLLYERYRESMNFNAHESVQHFLLNSETEVEFCSKTIQIKDGEKLIAVGYFDEGKKSLAGNLNFYDPDYKKYSLGKYLMLIKIAYAKKKKMDYYYTGYIALGNTKFDYKLFPDEQAVEVLLRREEVSAWIPFTKLGKEGLHEFGFWIHNGGKII